MLLKSLDPVFNDDARILILGSMPGRASLEAQQYYAHPRNLFWRLVSEGLGSELPDGYQSRLSWLRTHHIALWDVLAHCEREGSLDASIRARSEVPNPINELAATLERLSIILLNGKKAEQVFNKYIAPMSLPSGVAVEGVPSSSPANASIPYTVKSEHWSRAIRRGNVSKKRK